MVIFYYKASLKLGIKTNVKIKEQLKKQKCKQNTLMAAQVEDCEIN